jgi:hypothetical protein
MSSDLRASVQPENPIQPLQVLARQAFKTCHVQLPDLPDATSAIYYNRQFYCYVRFYPTVEAAQRGAQRLMDRGNPVVLTQVPKGLVLWVSEPDATLATKSNIRR